MSIVDTIKDAITSVTAPAPSEPSITAEQVADAIQRAEAALSATNDELAAQLALYERATAEANAALSRAGVLRHRSTVVQSAATTLKGYGNLTDATKWRDFLVTSREQLTSATDLTPFDRKVSLDVIEHGPQALSAVPIGSLADTRLGQLMTAAGYDPRAMWRGSLRGAEHRVADLTRQLIDARARLDS